MHNRRSFLRLASLAGAAIGTNSCQAGQTSQAELSKQPIIISTWAHGTQANEVGWPILANAGTALDAVEAGAAIVESDPTGTSVGLGGLPDREGIVTLDACIMNHKNECGAVAYLQDIEHPISVARRVMEKTEHVMLVGEGARSFAFSEGFPKQTLLTEGAAQAYQKWKTKSQYQPVINSENHDTIGLLALDAHGHLAGACTTSGMAYKLHGRVGDSPIIGAGLFVDNEVGAACATGLGEAIIRVAGSAIIVEMMRNGASPQEACEQAVKRILSKHDNRENLQVGFLALNNKGEYGAHAVYSGFNFALSTKDKQVLVDASYEFEWDED